MALNQDFIGKVYPAGPSYLVGREKVREFATAIGDMNAAYHDVAHAHAGIQRRPRILKHGLNLSAILLQRVAFQCMHVLAIGQHVAAGGIFQAQHEFGRCRLAAASRANRGTGCQDCHRSHRRGSGMLPRQPNARP